MEKIKAIPTNYGGITFRSKLEAEWAKFFDALKIKWIYEPDGYELSDGTRYLPDFFLPESKQWFEVKGVMSLKDEHKCEMLCRDSEKDVVIGLPNGEFYMYDMQFEDGLTKYDSNDCFINECRVCHKKSFMNQIGRYHCQCCKAYDGDGYINWIMCGDGEPNYLLCELTKEDWRNFSQIDVRN